VGLQLWERIGKTCRRSEYHEQPEDIPGEGGNTGRFCHPLPTSTPKNIDLAEQES
jgi:hypothetical protein